MSILISILLIACFLLLLVLPIVPAVIAANRSGQTDRLHISRERSDNIRYFADRFQHYLARDIGDDPEAFWAELRQAERHQFVAQKYLVIGGKQHPDWREWQQLSNDRQLIVLLAGSAQIPNQTVWLKDIFCPYDLALGQHITARAASSAQSLTVGSHCHLLRWVDAQNLTIGHQTSIHGRATATRRMMLGHGVRFQRLFAPCIHIEDTGQTPLTTNPAPLSQVTAATPIHRFDPALIQQGRYVFTGSIFIPAGTEATTDIVCGGDLRIGRGARINGHIKAKGNIICEPNVFIDGSLFSDHNIHLERSCTVSHLLIADKEAFIGYGCAIGRPDIPGTLNAEKVCLSEGSTVYGAVFAHKEGLTLSATDDATQLQPAFGPVQSGPVHRTPKVANT